MLASATSHYQSAIVCSSSSIHITNEIFPITSFAVYVDLEFFQAKQGKATMLAIILLHVGCYTTAFLASLHQLRSAWY